MSWRDSLTGLEYLRRAHEIADQGITVSLHAYQSYVFLDFREIYATADKGWDRLCDHLAGRGVPNLDDALIAFELMPRAQRVEGRPRSCRDSHVRRCGRDPAGDCHRC